VIWRDLRYAARALIRTPGFLAVAFVAIALGKKKNAPAAEPPERFEFIWPRLADLCTQETAVVFYSHSAAAE
jgi:hypothetical protein